MVALYAKLYAICQKHVKSIKSMTKPIHVSGQTYNHHITEHKAAITLGVIMGTFLGTYYAIGLIFVLLFGLKSNILDVWLTFSFIGSDSVLDAILLYEYSGRLLQDMHS